MTPQKLSSDPYRPCDTAPTPATTIIPVCMNIHACPSHLWCVFLYYLPFLFCLPPQELRL